jgi:8-oxo-dGTP pyrophosphatase MutT (NUDIX family)
VFWARRVHRDGWQFPQGGMNTDETPLEAMYRELREETGLLPEHVAVLGVTPGWLRYRLPQRACAATTGWSASARSRSGSCCSSPAKRPTCAWT